jgi:hypothetical protein
MYLYHFKLDYMDRGFLPIYYSLAQQLVRQDPQIHLFHVQASEDHQVEMVSVPTPLRFRTKENWDHGIQYFGLSELIGLGVPRVPHDDLLITRGKPTELETFVPGDDTLQSWLFMNDISLGFLPLKEWGVEDYGNDFLEPFSGELVAPILRTDQVEPGHAIFSKDGRFVNFSSAARENQMIVSSGFMPLTGSRKQLLNGMTLADVRGWHLDREMPTEALHTGLWVNNQTEVFPVSVPLCGLGTLSDALVGRDSWKSRGLDAFIKFWDKDLYDDWTELAVHEVYEKWWELVELEQKTFGEHSFFQQQESITRLAVMRKWVKRGKKTKA